MKKIKTRDIVKWSLPIVSGLILVIFSDYRDSSGRVNATDGLINVVMDIDNPKSEVALEKVDNTAAKSEKKKSKENKKKANNIIQPIEIPEMLVTPLVDDLIKQDIVVPEQPIEQPVEQQQPKPTLPIEPDIDIPNTEVIDIPPIESGVPDSMPQFVEPDEVPGIDEPSVDVPKPELPGEPEVVEPGEVPGIDEPNGDVPEVELPTQDIDNMPQVVEPDELPGDSSESDDDELTPEPPVIPDVPDWVKPIPPLPLPNDWWNDMAINTGKIGSTTNITVKEKIKWNNILPL